MGVTGLWRLIDASGKPVPLETLEGKVLAIDISIWIHQVLQGYQDKRGNAVPNAHLLGLYTRICKLLYFKIKPIFVFDGGVPLLKKNTIAARKKHKAIAAGKAAQMKNDLLHNLMKHSLVKGVLAKRIGEEVGESSKSELSKNEKLLSDMFKLPKLPVDHIEESDPEDSDSVDELSPRKNHKWKGNIHTVDVRCDDFKSLPADVRYDILTDLKETRKQNSWGRLHEIPEESNQFSSYQMKRLLKRRQVQEELEAAEQEMGGKTLTLEELEKLMTEQGVDTKSRDAAYRIASDSTTRMIYINDPKSLKSSQQIEENVKIDDSKPGCSKDLKFDDDSFTTIPEEEPSSVVFNIDEYDLDDEWDSDIEFIEQAVATPRRKKYFGKITSNPALAYMLENTELSQGQILELIEQSRVNIRNANKLEEKNKKRKSNSELEICLKKQKIDMNYEDSITIKEEIISDDDESEKNNIQRNPSPITATINMSDSDSDSDDFVEVQDTPFRPKINEKKMEIVVNKDEKIDGEDIFADIFSNESISQNSSFDFCIKNEEVSMDSLNNEEPEIIDLDLPIDKILKENIVIEKTVLAINAEKTNETKEKCISIEEIKSPEKPSINNSIPSSVQTTKDIVETIKTPSPIKNKNDKVLEIPANQLNETISQKTPEKKNDIPASPKTPENISKVSERVNEVMSRLKKDREELLSKVNNNEELLEMQSQLEIEHQSLNENIGKLERQATEITEQMRSEAQDLLRLFGIPFVVAPQEAEAQCAYLETINLTDGTVTDDSDIWLFGGRCVYRNFFNNAKRVMQYQSKDIEHHFKLSRQQMIQLALLVGSDYTVGIPGIGPVTALEILASFPSQGDDLLRGLSNFSSWLGGGRIVGPGKATLRNKLKSIVVDRGFPSQSVVQAYLFPTVDESRENFTWGKPNLVLLSDYTREKFGWTKAKFEETMGPVIKRMEEGKSQKNIMQYFKVKTAPKSIEDSLSKRVQKAVRRMGKGDDPDSNPDEPDSIEDVTKKGKKGLSKKKTNIGEEIDGVLEEDMNNDLEKGVKIVKKNIKKPIEVIPQREKDKQIALKKKLQAIELFRKSKKGPGKSGKKNVRPTRNFVKEQANLSESSSDEN